MKFGKIGTVGKAVLVSACALIVATLFTACSTLTVGFLFVATTRQTPGQLETYEVNSESGVLRTIPTSPFPSGGRDPISEAVSPDAKFLYVANQDDNNVVQFGIGNDGKLYPQTTINLVGAFPVSIAVNFADTYFYALETLGPQPGCTPETPCPGAISSYAVTSASTANTAGSFLQGSLGQLCTTIPPATTPTCTLGNSIVYSNNLNYWPLQLTPTDTTTILTPTAMYVLPGGSNIYVTAYTVNGNSVSQGYLFEFAANSDGSLSPLNGGLPLSLGKQPTAMASDSSGAYLYVADKQTNTITSFAIGSDGTLSPAGTAATGNAPTSLAIFADKYLYVTDSLDSSVTGFSISSGTLSNIATYTSDVNPIAITVDPRNLGFLYTVNYLGNSLSGYKINPSDGTLINTQRSPYASSLQPTAISGVPHGGTTTK